MVTLNVEQAGCKANLWLVVGKGKEFLWLISKANRGRGQNGMPPGRPLSMSYVYR